MLGDQAILISVAEAVAEELRNETFTLKPTISRNRYVTELKLKDAAGLQINAVPGDVDEVRKVDRARTSRTCRIDVFIRKRLDEGTETDNDTGELDQAEVDRLVLFSEQIHEFFDGRRLSLYQPAMWTENPDAFRPIYDQDHLRTLRQFTSVVGVKYRVVA